MSKNLQIVPNVCFAATEAEVKQASKMSSRKHWLQNAGKSPNGTFAVTRPMLQASFWLNSEKEDKKCIVIYCDKL